MPFDQHLRVTMSGLFQAGPVEASPIVEQWSIRLNLTAPSLGNDITQARLDDVVANCRAWFSRASTGIVQTCFLTGVKLARINALGKYDADPLIAAFRTGGGSSTTGAARMPSSVATVVSLRSDRRGPTGRGRMYVPGFQGPLDDFYCWTDTARTALQTSTAQLLTDLNNWPGIDGASPNVCIASSKGYNSRVTGVAVGRVPDTMRSRRTSIAEQYLAATAVT
jgi:hypothetical protein